MKKYLYTLIPFVICFVISISLQIIGQRDAPHPSEPFINPWTLQYLSTNWIIIGLVITFVLVSGLLISDLVDYGGKLIEKYRDNKKR